MSENFELGYIQFSLGTISTASAGTLSLGRIPSHAGGITILNVEVLAVGNPAAVASETLGSAKLMSGTGVLSPTFTTNVATAAQALGTISNATALAFNLIGTGIYVGPSSVGTSTSNWAWLGMAHNGGTLVSEAVVNVTYMMGK